MKAVVYDRYGPPDVLRVEQVRMPTPGPKQVLVEVVAEELGPSLRWATATPVKASRSASE